MKQILKVNKICPGQLQNYYDCTFLGIITSEIMPSTEDSTHY